MADQTSTLKLGVDTGSSLSELQALREALTQTKSVMSEMGGSSASFGTGGASGLMRALADIKQQVAGIKTMFDDLSKTLGNSRGMGSMNKDLKEAVDLFMQNKKSAEEVVAVAKDLGGAVGAAARQIAKMSDEGRASMEGWIELLQSTISDEELLAAAIDKVAMKQRQAAAAKAAFDQTPQGQMEYLRMLEQAYALDEKFNLNREKNEREHILMLIEANEMNQKFNLSREKADRDHMLRLNEAYEMNKRFDEAVMRDKMTEAQWEDRQWELRRARMIEEAQFENRVLDLRKKTADDSAVANARYLDMSLKQQAEHLQKLKNLMSQGASQERIDTMFSPLAQSQLPNFAGIASQAGYSLDAAGNLDKYTNSAQNAKKATDEHAAAMREAHSAARGLAGGFQMMWLTWGSIVPLMAGFAISTILKDAAKGFADVQYQMTFVKELSGDTTHSVADLSEQLHGMAKDLGITTTTAGQGLRTLAQAGLDVNQAFFALPAAFKLATVGEIELAAASTTLTGVLNAYSMNIGMVDHAADMLAKAGANSATSIGNLADAMKYAAPTAANFNVSIGETLTVLDALAKRNIVGTSAGTAVKNMIKELAAPTGTQQQNILQNVLGFNAYDAQGQLKPILDQIEELKTKLGSFDKESQGKILTALFGERGDKAFFALLGEGNDKLRETLKTLEDSAGFTDQVFTALQRTVKGNFQLMVADIDNSLAQVGANAQSALVDMMREIRSAMSNPVVVSGLTGLMQSVAELGKLAVTYGPIILAFFATLKGGALAAAGVEALYAAIDVLIAGVASAVTWFGSLTAASITLEGAAIALRGAFLAIPWVGLAGLVAGLAAAYLTLRERKDDLAERSGKELKDLGDVAAKMEEENRKLALRNQLMARGIALKDIEQRQLIVESQQKIQNLNADIADREGKLKESRGKESFMGLGGISSALRFDTPQQQFDQSMINFRKTQVMVAEANVARIQLDQQNHDALVREAKDLADLQAARDAAAVEANRTTGAVHYDPNNKDQQRKLEQDKQAIVEEYNFALGMAKDRYNQLKKGFNKLRLSKHIITVRPNSKSEAGRTAK
jgi:TP901 family phage tail tape measure protein